MVNADGNNLHRIESGGHPEWYEGNLLTIPGDKGFLALYDVDTKKVVGRIGDDGVFPAPGGDKAYSPNGEWYVVSHRIELESFYTFYRFADKARFLSEAIKIYRGNLAGNVTRIDGAPRWNRASDRILIGGIAEDGTRQLSIITMHSGNE